jgi:hypothetical protein
MKMDKTKFTASSLTNQEEAIILPSPLDKLMKAIIDANLTATERLDIMMALTDYILSKQP